PAWRLAALVMAMITGGGAALTVSVTLTVWLAMFGEDTVTVPEYVPGGSVGTIDPFTASVSVDGVVPLAGVTIMKFPRFAMLAAGLNEALNVTLPLLVTWTVVAAGSAA